MRLTICLDALKDNKCSECNDFYQCSVCDYFQQRYEQGRLDAIEEIATKLEEELTMVMPRDKVKYVMYKVHTVLEQLKEQRK